MRVILDTNVLVSALISPKAAPDRLYQAWRARTFELLTSEEQLQEFRRVTRHPRLRKYLHPSAAGAMLNEVRLLAAVVTDLPRVKASVESADLFLLAIALAARANYLVTGDKRILALGRFSQTRIVDVAGMLELLP